MNNTSFWKRMIALVLSVVMIVGLIPNVNVPVFAAGQSTLTAINKVADNDSFDNWRDYYGNNSLLPDGNRGVSTWKAGGVWTDKSVYTDSSKFPNSVTMDNEANNFLVALSALASNKEIVGQSSTPTDTMLVLDVSGSMDDNSKAEGMVEAANRAIHSLMAQNRNNRVGVMLYSGTNSNAGATATTLLLPLDHYTTTSTVNAGTRLDPEYIPAYLTISNETSSPDVGFASGVLNSSKNSPPRSERAVTGATYIQRGLYDAWKEFEKVTDIKVPAGNVQAGSQRSPVIILMSDGRPTLATESYNNVGNRDSEYGTGSENSTSWETVFLTQLTAAWVKGAVADHYGTDAMFYTLGLATGNDTYATGVLNPSSTTNTNMLNWWTNFINGEKRNNGTVRVQNSSGLLQRAWDIPYDNDRFATGVGRNYSDGYWSANDVADMITAFQQIVDEIGLQSAYSATLVESGEADLDGYITVQDEIGAMMQVKDIKGILLGNKLFSGEEMAKSLNEGALGSVDTPTAYGDEFVRTVKERLGLTDKTGASGETITATSQAQQLIQAAYADMQLSYNAGTGAYSNYIGWYGDANNAYLGFWDKDTGITATGAPVGAKYINKSYGYLGGTSAEEDAADMMHIVVMVRTEITTGHQTVLFKIPSSLIPMVEYKVELEGDELVVGTEAKLTVTEADPIRLVYEVGLPDDVNSVNIEQKVKEYLAQDGSNHIHKDANGNYVFYANGWDDNHDDVAPVISDLTDAQKLELTKYVAESHFVPNTVNERFYIQENSVVYTKNGNAYIPVTSGINANGTYYFARNIVTMVNGTARVMVQYEQLQSATIANANNFQKNTATGYWEVKAGTIRQQLSNVVLPKTDENGDPANLTGTIANTDQLWVNVTSNDPSNYNIYSFLGNNGKLTVAPATGIKVTKDLAEVADGASADEKFAIAVTIDSVVTAPVVTDTDGEVITDYSTRVTGGKTVVTVNLADGESAVISGLPGNVGFTVTEAEHDKYNATYAGATTTVAAAIVEGVVTNKPILPGALYITKEVVHAHDGEAFPTDGEFEFHVTFKDKNGNLITNTEFALTNNYEPTLEKLKTDENGVMTGKLRHGETVYIKGIPAGATVTVEEVNIPEYYTSTEYRSRNHSGATADNDGVVTIVSEQNATVVVTNTYTPKSTSAALDLSIEKTLRVDLQPTGGRSFTFVLEKWNGTAWETVNTYENAVTWAANEIQVGDNVKSFSSAVPVSLGTFAETGTYIYQIYEVIPTNRVPGMTYDRTIHTITVTVSDVDGQLVAVARDEHGNVITDADSDGGLDFTASFLNVEDAAIISIDIEKRVNDTSKNPLTSKAGFEFIAQTAKVESGVWSVKSISEGGRSFTVFSDGLGEARMTDVYREPGTYYYIISEKDDGKASWSYSKVSYQVTVVVTRDNTGNLVADMTITAVGGTANEIATVTDGTKGKLVFVNTYDPTDAQVELNALVKKHLEGRNMIAGEFTFAIFKNGEAVYDANGMLTNLEDAVATGTNDAQGNVTFAPASLTFSQVGKYEYDVIEVKGSLGGVTYDPVIYDLVVEVTDNGNGALHAQHYFEDSVAGQITFRNTYTAKPTKVVIEGIKSIQVNSGVKNLTANMFTFGLYENGVKKAETKNLANGSFVFDAIEYHKDDAGRTFTYEVREEIPAEAVLEGGKYVLNGVTYSDESFVVTVEVKDNGDGTLSTVVTNNGAANIKFVNIYNSSLASVILNGTKVLDGRNLQNGEYSFILHESNAAFTERNAVVQQNGADVVTNDANDAFTFNIKNLGMGYHYYILSEVIPEQRATGISYDANVYYITVQVSDSGIGQMNAIVTVSHSGQPNVSNPPIVFKNVYSPEPGELPLSGTKTYNGGKALENDVFSVGLYDSNSQLLQTALIKANGSFVFENLKYQAADVGETYTYTIKEIIPEGATNNGNGTFTFGNNIYDGTVYTLKVTVTDDDKDGKLEIDDVLTKGGNNVNAITFTNTFVPDSITHIVKAKKTYEKGLKGNDFLFKLVSTDGKTNVDQTKENAANGDITFDAITFSAAGEYKFKLTEKKDSILSFILPSQAEYEITITVVNENGVLRVSDVETVNTKNTGETDLEFINTYVIDGEDEITLRGTKKLAGDRTQVKVNEFEFGLYNANGGLIESVKNDANGNFEFATLKFDETDVPVNGQKQITYTVREIAGDNARYTYDDAIYTVVVTVKDNDQGGVTATYTVNAVENGAIAFTNTYTNPAPVTYTPLAKKNYNKTLNGGEFKFTLEGEINGTPVSQEKTNAAGGSITFDTLSFPEAGTYTFTVKEIDKVLGFIEYSAAEYALAVNIIDTKGVLSIGSVTVNNDPDGTIEFTNTYTIDGEDEVTIRGTKALTGGRTAVEANEFAFGLYDAEGKLIESVKNDADGNFAFTTLKFDETDVPVSGQKQITYTVKEIKGSDIRVTYDETVYTVVVTVKDNEQGGVTASYTVNSEAEGLITFTNVYTPKPEDITVDFDVIKTVVNKGSEKIGPEGFEFLLNALADGVADVTVKSDEKGKAKFTLTFTEDDIGNTYTYKLTEVNSGKANVTYSNAEYTITVAIELNENNELVATLTKNSENVTAVVAEFENVYNYTPPKSDNPQTGDSMNLYLWSALLFASGGGIFGTTLYGRKKREEET